MRKMKRLGIELAKKKKRRLTCHFLPFLETPLYLEPLWLSIPLLRGLLLMTMCNGSLTVLRWFLRSSSLFDSLSVWVMLALDESMLKLDGCWIRLFEASLSSLVLKRDRWDISVMPMVDSWILFSANILSRWQFSIRIRLSVSWSWESRCSCTKSMFAFLWFSSPWDPHF